MSPLKALAQKVPQKFYRRFLRPVLRPIISFRSYLLDGLRNELQHELQRVTTSIEQQADKAAASIEQQVRKAVASIELQVQKAVASIELQVQKATTSNLEEIRSELLIDSEKIVTAGELEKIFFEISKNIFEWSKCDTILACQLTYDGISLLLKGREIIYIRSIDDAIYQLQNRIDANIGVASPWLMWDLIRDRNSLYLLLKSCKRNILYIEKNHCQSNRKKTRRYLHKIGFYEIAQITENEGSDFVSVGLTPDGDYSLFGSEPAIHSNAKKWVSMRASRLPVSRTGHLRWENLTLCPFESSAIGLRPPDGGFSLAVTQPFNEPVKGEVYIKATFSWDHGGSGHAALVGCYSGPGDNHMYVCLLQAPTDSSPQITLYIIDGTCRPISVSTIIPTCEFNVNAGLHSVTIALFITTTRVAIDVGAVTLIDVENTELIRTPRVGIRARESLFGITQILTQKQ